MPHGGPPLQTPLPRTPSPLGALPPPAALLLRAASVRLPGYRHGAAPRPPTGGGCWDVGGRTGGRGGALAAFSGPPPPPPLSPPLPPRARDPLSLHASRGPRPAAAAARLRGGVGSCSGPCTGTIGVGALSGLGHQPPPRAQTPAKCALAASTNSAEDDCGELWLPVAVAVCVTTVVVVALPGVLESITSGVGSGASRVSRGAVQAKWDTGAYITPAGQKYSEEPAGRSAAPELKPRWLGNSVYVTRVKWVSVCSKDVAQALTLGYAFSLLRFYWYN